MAAIYKLIVMALMTSAATFGYRRVFGSRHRMKGRRLAGGKSDSLDPAYDFFKSSVIKKPVSCFVLLLLSAFLDFHSKLRCVLVETKCERGESDFIVVDG